MTLNIDIKEEQKKSQEMINQQGLRVLVCAGTGCVANGSLNVIAKFKELGADVSTFYAQFSLEPKGKYEIKVCDGTACHVRGSLPVLNAIKEKIKLEEGKFTTKDGLFTLEIVSCLGACGLAPVVVINEKVYPQMTPDAISIVLDTLMKEEQ